MIGEMMAAAGMATMARIKTVEEQVLERLQEIDPRIDSIRLQDNWPKNPEVRYSHTHLAFREGSCYMVHDGDWDMLIRKVQDETNTEVCA